MSPARARQCVEARWCVSKDRIPLNGASKADSVSTGPSFCWSGGPLLFTHRVLPAQAVTQSAPNSQKHFFNMNKEKATRSYYYIVLVHALIV